MFTEKHNKFMDAETMYDFLMYAITWPECQTNVYIHGVEHKQINSIIQFNL